MILLFKNYYVFYDLFFMFKIKKHIKILWNTLNLIYFNLAPYCLTLIIKLEELSNKYIVSFVFEFISTKTNLLIL